ncbi:MAG TPA: phosphoribosylamine--glycine ligase [Thermoanaerobaculia bacterium]|nr:phosphoribosylamine--glycine ligase [Thermoanaerobaculia bacterium]
MKILVVGGGGREHALCSTLRRSAFVEELFCAPGNPGIAELADCLPVSVGDIVEIADLAENLRMDLTVVGPELPLSLGIADEFGKRGLPIFGPSRLAARIETSKVFAKEFFRRHGIATAQAIVCASRAEAEAAIAQLHYPVVLKADGLAAGKGVLTAESREEADRALKLFFDERLFGSAGDRVLVEEFLRGTEASFLAVCDGQTPVPLPTARDYKKVYDGDRGPNTGGMGGHSPAASMDAAICSQVLKEIIWPTLKGLSAEGRPFCGVLYAGLMLTESGPKILEFNARFGDPETEVILPRVNSDLAALLVSATRGELEGITPIEVSPEACVGIVLCSGGYPGPFEKGKPITGLPEAERMPSVQIFHAGTAIEGGRLVTAGGRVLVVTAMGPSLSEAAARAYEACDTIEFEGKHLRRDIPPKSARQTKP